MKDVEYAGFWIRALASLIDTLALTVVIVPLLFVIYGMKILDNQGVVMGFWDVVLNWVFPPIVVILFWIYKSATPGKMLLNISIVDAHTGNKLTVVQSIVRYLGYFVSTIPLCLGFIWIAFDPKKQAWHDKLAGTVSIINAAEDHTKAVKNDENQSSFL